MYFFNRLPPSFPLIFKTRSSIPFYGLFFIFLLSHCQKDKEAAQDSSTYETTVLSNDVSDLFFAEGNLEADTVWIYEQGGPSGILDEKNLELFPNHDNVTKVYVHQVLTYNNSLYTSQLTELEAEKETDVNTEILHRIITHFKSKNKKVIVIGHSYGAFVVTRYLAHKGNSSADKFIIMAGRIDTEKVFYEGLISRQYLYFPDYKTPTIHPSIQPETEEERTELLLIGTIVKPRYSQKLKTLNLNNLIYVYAKDDDAVGQLTESERQFLDSKQTKIVAIEKGGHGAMFESPYNNTIYELMMK